MLVVGCVCVDVFGVDDLDYEGLGFFDVEVLEVVLGVVCLDGFCDECEGLEDEVDDCE